MESPQELKRRICNALYRFGVEQPLVSAETSAAPSLGCLKVPSKAFKNALVFAGCEHVMIGKYGMKCALPSLKCLSDIRSRASRFTAIDLGMMKRDTDNLWLFGCKPGNMRMGTTELVRDGLKLRVLPLLPAAQDLADGAVYGTIEVRESGGGDFGGTKGKYGQFYNLHHHTILALAPQLKPIFPRHLGQMVQHRLPLDRLKNGLLGNMDKCGGGRLEVRAKAGSEALNLRSVGHAGIDILNEMIGLVEQDIILIKKVSLLNYREMLEHALGQM